MQSTHEIPQTQWLFFKAAFGWAFKEGIIAAMPPFPPIWHIGKPYGAFKPGNAIEALPICNGQTKEKCGWGIARKSVHVHMDGMKKGYSLSL